LNDAGGRSIVAFEGRQRYPTVSDTELGLIALIHFKRTHGDFNATIFPYNGRKGCAIRLDRDDYLFTPAETSSSISSLNTYRVGRRSKVYVYNGSSILLTATSILGSGTSVRERRITGAGSSIEQAMQPFKAHIKISMDDIADMRMVSMPPRDDLILIVVAKDGRITLVPTEIDQSWHDSLKSSFTGTGSQDGTVSEKVHMPSEEISWQPSEIPGMIKEFSQVRLGAEQRSIESLFDARTGRPRDSKRSYSHDGRLRVPQADAVKSEQATQAEQTPLDHTDGFVEPTLRGNISHSDLDPPDEDELNGNIARVVEDYDNQMSDERDQYRLRADPAFFGDGTIAIDPSHLQSESSLDVSCDQADAQLESCDGHSSLQETDHDVDLQCEENTRTELSQLLTLLQDILVSVHKAFIHVESGNDTSLLNRAQLALENHTGFIWDWWPLQPPLYTLESGMRRIVWMVSDFDRLPKTILTTQMYGRRL
jgi:hypothetical protein